jgi:transcriptional regulator with XRE-family HTH domain
MDIKTEQDITPEAARSLRKQFGLTQAEFWSSVGSSQGSGQWFENGKRNGVPKPIRCLIFIRYVAMLDFDVSQPEQADALVRITREITARKEALRLKREAKAAQDAAEKAKAEATRLKI